MLSLLARGSCSAMLSAALKAFNVLSFLVLRVHVLRMELENLSVEFPDDSFALPTASLRVATRCSRRASRSPARFRDSLHYFSKFGTYVVRCCVALRP